jgi:hypothetical protein
MFNENKIKKAELFQLLLLNSIYSQSASKDIIFQGGEADFFQNKENQQETINALQTDLNRFIPENIYLVYQATQFDHFIKAVNLVTSKLLQQGMKMYFESLRNKS